METLIKILLIGPRKCGKTSFRSLICHGFMHEGYEPSENVSYSISQLGNKSVQLYEVCDLNSYRIISEINFKLIVLMFEKGSHESFRELQSIFQGIHKDDQSFFLVANKKDLGNCLFHEEIVKFCHDHGIKYAESCLISGDDFEDLIESISQKLIIIP